MNEIERLTLEGLYLNFEYGNFAELPAIICWKKQVEKLLNPESNKEEDCCEMPERRPYLEKQKNGKYRKKVALQKTGEQK